MSKFKNISSWSQVSKQSLAHDAPADAPDQSSPLASPLPSPSLVQGSLSRIRRGRKQYRNHTDEAHILQLMASIEAHGFSGSLPVIAIQDEHYDYEYLGGHTTGEALQRLGYTTALLSVESVDSPLALAEFSYQLNGAHRPLNPLDDTLAILDILAEALALRCPPVEPDEIPALIRQIARHTHKVDTDKIACIQETWQRNQFAISIRSFAASRLPLLLLPPDLKAAIQRGVSPASALEINKIHDPSIRSQLLAQALQLSVADIKRAVRSALQPAPANTQHSDLFQLVRSLSSKAKKIDFDSLPPQQQQALSLAIQHLQSIIEQIHHQS